MVDDLDIIKEIYKLDDVLRWSGLYVTHTDSVAQHSYHVACIATILGIIEKSVFHKEIDLEQVLIRALFHDITDSVLTHITYEVKNQNPGLKKAVKASKDKIIKRWKLYKNKYEYKYLIEIADVIDAIMFCQKEVNRNNMDFLTILKRQKKYFKLLKDKYECAEYFYEYYMKERSKLSGHLLQKIVN